MGRATWRPPAARAGRHELVGADAERMFTIMELRERNRSLHERHGFVVTQELLDGNGSHKFQHHSKRSDPT